MNNLLLGKRIREERLRLNLTQEKLAEQINLTPSYLGQIERGERSLSLENLIKLANQLGVSIDYLLSDSLSINTDATMIKLSQILNGRSLFEKEMAIDILRTLFLNMDKQKN